MEDNLLVRVYNVGFGDCIYARIPDGNTFYNILIDCGSSEPVELGLEKVLNDLRGMLPKEKGSKKRLDLLVVTHPHADHLNGFDPKCFKDIRIRHIWLSSFMMENHPQAKKSHALQDLAEKAVKSLLARGMSLKGGLDTLLTNSLCNVEAMKALRSILPQANNIDSLYVCRDLADPNKKMVSVQEREKHMLGFNDGTTCLQDFREPSTCLRILAPEWNIDGYYLGKEGSDYNSLLSLYESNGHDQPEALSYEGKKSTPQPYNISKRDFRLLCNSLLYSALAFAQEDNELKNNTSVVLLLEWRGRRLLFAGDAQWKGRRVKKGRRNSCWDVMLKMLESEAHLSKPLDFLKVGHHGSVNGTPFVDQKNAEQSILDKILPKEGGAQVVVSTLAGKHGEKKEVPYLQMMKELGFRSNNRREYPDDLGVLQPQRTDGERKPWIDVTIKPASN
jgi:beta-lactamase superfamily II metal-dependent hydrolase